MKISRISVYQVDLPLEYPYWLSGGRLKFECLDATLVKIETDEGYVGWGEGTPWGHTYVPCLLYTSPSPRDLSTSRMPSSA